MINQESITFVESLVISGVGMVVVLSILATLAVSIKVFSGLLGMFGKDSEEAVKANNTDNTKEDLTEQLLEDYAIIAAVMDEELNKDGEKYKITSINEVGI